MTDPASGRLTAWFDDPDPKENSFFALLTPLVYGTYFDGYGDFELKLYSCPIRLREPLIGPNPMRISYGMNAFNSVQFPDPQTKRLGQVQGSAAKTLLVNKRETALVVSVNGA